MPPFIPDKGSVGALRRKGVLYHVKVTNVSISPVRKAKWSNGGTLDVHRLAGEEMMWVATLPEGPIKFKASEKWCISYRNKWEAEMEGKINPHWGIALPDARISRVFKEDDNFCVQGYASGAMWVDGRGWFAVCDITKNGLLVPYKYLDIEDSGVSLANSPLSEDWIDPNTADPEYTLSELPEGVVVINGVQYVRKEAPAEKKLQKQKLFPGRKVNFEG